MKRLSFLLAAFCIGSIAEHHRFDGRETLAFRFRRFIQSVPDPRTGGASRKSMRYLIAEMVLRDERSVIPIGSYQREFGVTLSLPSAVGRGGVTMTLPPDPSAEEKSGLERSAENLRTALKRVTS